MNEQDPLQFGSRVVHCGQDPSYWTTQAIVPPITSSVAFLQSIDDLFEDDDAKLNKALVNK
jgi:hypothetical protein